MVKKDFGCQDYIAFKYHMDEAYNEKNNKKYISTTCPNIAIFSKKYYTDIQNIENEKKYDYCFIGSINSCIERRQWVIEFAKKYFTDNSIFINTDTNSSFDLLGKFDLSKKNKGYSPKEHINYQSKDAQYRIVKDNLYYFESMRQSKFCLCPAGDAPWSFRFYETLMCESIPIVESHDHTYRTIEESNIEYKYYLYNDNKSHIYSSNIINYNTNIFIKNHLLK